MRAGAGIGRRMEIERHDRADGFDLGSGQPWAPAPGGRLGAASATRRRQPWLGAFLAAEAVVDVAARGRLDGIVGWGMKPTARYARAVARLRGLPYWTVEDGFIRSVGLGKAGDAPASLVVDDLGPHIDAGKPSRLERLIATPVPEALLARAAALRDQICRLRITKYNHLPDAPLRLGATARRRVLLVDQVLGDFSIRGAAADERSFAAMFDAASREPGTEVLVRVHPDVAAGFARGYLAEALKRRPRPVGVIAADVSPHAVLDEVDEVWTVSSQLGFDALIRGVPVRCFGVPFYAGWGLTADTPPGARGARALARRSAAPQGLAGLLAASLILYPRYRDLETGRLAAPERVIDQLAAARRRALGP